MNKKYTSILAITGLVASMVAAVPALADNSVQANVGASVSAQGVVHSGMWQGRGGMMKPAVFGTVTAISGNTITVTSKMMGPRGEKQGDQNDNNVVQTPTTTPPTQATTTYTVDATSATVTKNGTASSVSNIAVGDTIMAQGTLTGTNLVATSIRDVVGMGNKDKGQKPPMPAPVIAGNGQPIVAGKITAISGSTITITNASNVTYTVDATNAKIANKNVLGTIANVTVGDNVVVQGTVNGNSITAYSVTDQGATVASQPNQNNGNNGQKRGIFGAIGNFFSHLFGF